MAAKSKKSYQQPLVTNHEDLLDITAHLGSGKGKDTQEKDCKEGQEKSSDKCHKDCKDKDCKEWY